MEERKIVTTSSRASFRNNRFSLFSMALGNFCFTSLIYSVSCGILGNVGKKMSNARYFTVYVIWMILCLIIQYLPNNDTIVNNNLDKIFGYHGIEIVYRACCALGASFGVLFLLTLMWPWLHHMFLGVFLVFVIFFSWLFLWGIDSNNWVIGFRNVARIASGAYLILQLMAFVDFSFTCHEILTDKMDETNKRYKYTDKTCCCKNQWTSMYLTLSFGLCILSIGACIAFYFLFRVNGEMCGKNVFGITLVLLMGIICTVLCLHEKFNKGFLPPSIFFAIITIYLLNALLSNSDNQCNPFTSSSNYWVTIINVVLTVGSGYWMAYRIVNNETVDVESSDPEKAEKGEKDTVKIPDDDSFQWCIFNFCMVLGCCYLAMMCSAWYNGDITSRPPAIFAHTSEATFWVYNASIWIGFVVFLYILFAPLIFSSRDY